MLLFAYAITKRNLKKLSEFQGALRENEKEIIKSNLKRSVYCESMLCEAFLGDWGEKGKKRKKDRRWKRRLS